MLIVLMRKQARQLDLQEDQSVSFSFLREGWARLHCGFYLSPVYRRSLGSGLVHDTLSRMGLNLVADGRIYIGTRMVRSLS